MENKGLELDQPDYTWQPTFQLRWFNKELFKIDHESVFKEKTLQQKWVKIWNGGSIMDSEWRDIPFVD